MDLHDGFYNRIKKWARENNTTIEAIMNGSSGGKWSQAVYYGWRQSEGLPKGENILALAQYMGVSCDWIITGDEFMREDDVEEHRPGLGVKLASDKDYRKGMKKILENYNFLPPKVASLLLKALELDDAGMELISENVDLLLRHSRLQKNSENDEIEDEAISMKKIV